MSEKRSLIGCNLSEMQAIAAELGMPRFAAKQLLHWLYTKRATAIEAMTDISAKNRALLVRKVRNRAAQSAARGRFDRRHEKISVPNAARLGRNGLYSRRRPRNALRIVPSGLQNELCLLYDGQTGLERQSVGGRDNEPDSRRARQRATHQHRLHGHGRAVRQYARNSESARNSHCAVGTGVESAPHHGFYGRSAARFAAVFGAERSTFGGQSAQSFCRRSPADDARRKGVPDRNGGTELKRHDFAHQRRLSFEYIVFEGVNDTPRHARQLVRLLDGLPCRVNLIRFHRIPGVAWHSPSEERMVWLRDYLTENGLICTIRRSRGEDIAAACGMLSTNEKS